jgi:hypothetical protein
MQRLKLVVAGQNKEAIETLLALLEQAEAGLITGIAFVALRHGEDFCVGLAGRGRTAPYLTLGLLKALEAEIHKVV